MAVGGAISLYLLVVVVSFFGLFDLLEIVTKSTAHLFSFLWFLVVAAALFIVEEHTDLSGREKALIITALCPAAILAGIKLLS